MKYQAILAVGFACFATGAIAEITAEQVAGKTLTLDKATFIVGTDGSLTGQTNQGDALVGSWQVKDGKWCRTIKEPARLAGTACQDASIKGRNLSLFREDGSALVYKMR